MTSDFLDNLANHQYQKMNNEPMIKGDWRKATNEQIVSNLVEKIEELLGCLLYTSPSPRDATLSRMPSSA